MRYRIIKNYCWYQGKWFHQIKDFETNQSVLTYSNRMVKKYERLNK